MTTRVYEELEFIHQRLDDLHKYIEGVSTVRADIDIVNVKKRVNKLKQEIRTSMKTGLKSLNSSPEEIKLKRDESVQPARSMPTVKTLVAEMRRVYTLIESYDHRAGKNLWALCKYTELYCYELHTDEARYRRNMIAIHNLLLQFRRMTPSRITVFLVSDSFNKRFKSVYGNTYLQKHYDGRTVQ